MIPVPDLDFLQTKTARRKNLAEAFDADTQAVRARLADQGGEVYIRHKPGLIAWKWLFVVQPLAGEQEQYNLILVKPDAVGAIQLLVRQAG